MGDRYRAAVTAFGGISIEADSEEEAIEKLNAALAECDTGELNSLTMDYVERESGLLWEQAEARERGIDF